MSRKRKRAKGRKRQFVDCCNQDELFEKLREIFGRPMRENVRDGVECMKFPSEKIAREKLRQWNGELWEGPLTSARLWDAIERDRLSKN